MTLADSPDGLAYIATTGEVWVTTPRSGKLALQGSPEGFAVAPGDGRFFTNLEDKSQTLEIDVRSRKVGREGTPGTRDRRWAEGVGGGLQRRGGGLRAGRLPLGSGGDRRRRR